MSEMGGRDRHDGDTGATDQELRAALIFWVDRARRFEEKLDRFAYMKARGALTPEFMLGNRIFEEAQEAMRRGR